MDVQQRLEGSERLGALQVAAVSKAEIEAARSSTVDMCSCVITALGLSWIVLLSV